MSIEKSTLELLLDCLENASILSRGTLEFKNWIVNSFDGFSLFLRKETSTLLLTFDSNKVSLRSGPSFPSQHFYTRPLHGYSWFNKLENAIDEADQYIKQVKSAKKE